MARPRSSARSVRTARDNAKARRLGYANYYDYRLHASGQLPPTFQLSPLEISRMRGHAGGYAVRIQFLLSLGEGDLIIMPHGLSSVEFDEDQSWSRIRTTRRKGRLVKRVVRGSGIYLEIVKLVIDGETGADRTYILRNLTRDDLIDTIEEEQRRGAIFSPQPSLDQRRLVAEREADGGY